MNSALIVVLAVGVGFVVLAYLIRQWIRALEEKQKPSEELLEIMKLLQEGAKEDRKVLLSSLQKNTNSLNQRLDKAAEVIGKVQKNIGEMSEIGRGMRQLQEFLSSPKLRGNIGEQILKDLLSQMLPKQKFHLQYSFSSGVMVDAAIKTANGIIPVDSKFPMENFRKYSSEKDKKVKKQIKKLFINDVRKHIRDIGRKYILTEEGTLDYALMYIPSESVYYEVVNEPELFDYAGEHRVLPVSPTTFYAYLKAILMSFEGEKIERKAKEILSALRAIQKDYENVTSDLSTLQRHFNNASNMLTNVLTGFSQLGQRLERTRLLGESDKKLIE